MGCEAKPVDISANEIPVHINVLFHWPKKSAVVAIGQKKANGKPEENHRKTRKQQGKLEEKNGGSETSLGFHVVDDPT